jgi:hypothetical protein
MVPDEEMEELIRSGNCAAIENASCKDPGLISRGWRNGTLFTRWTKADFRVVTQIH